MLRICPESNSTLFVLFVYFVDPFLVSVITIHEGHETHE